MKILILTIVSLLLSQVFARFMPYNNLQSKLNPLQETALNDEPNQRLKDAQLFRSNDNNYLSAEDYNPGLGQSQFKDYDMNVDYGGSRINEEDARMIDPRYKKGAFEGHEHTGNVGYWYPGLSRYPSRYEDSKSLSKRSSSEEASAQQQQQQQPQQQTSAAVAPRKSQAVAAGAPVSSAVAEKRDDSSASKSENAGAAAAAAASSSSENKNEQGEISDKGASPMDVKRSSRETEEEECEEEGEEPEADADDAWYDDDEELDDRQPLRLDRQATHLFSGGGEAKDKSNLVLKDKAARSLTSEGQNNPDPLAPHLSIRKRNIAYPRVRRHLGAYAYNNYEDEEQGAQQHHSFESSYDANDADQYLLDYDDQGSVRRRRFLPPGRRNKRQIDLSNSTLTTTTTTPSPVTLSAPT